MDEWFDEGDLLRKRLVQENPIDGTRVPKTRCVAFKGKVLMNGTDLVTNIFLCEIFRYTEIFQTIGVFEFLNKARRPKSD